MILQRKIFAWTWIFMFTSKAHFCLEVLFKRTFYKTSLLTDVSSFGASSKIECGSQCILKMNSHSCTAFTFDEPSVNCTCGRMLFAPLVDLGGEELLHINSECKKFKPGLFPVKFVRGISGKANIVLVKVQNSDFRWNLNLNVFGDYGWNTHRVLSQQPCCELGLLSFFALL